MREQVTFYRSYGFKDRDGWRIPLRAWVHEPRLLSAVTGRLSAALGVSDEHELATFHRRFRHFVADSECREALSLRFEEDDQDRRIVGAEGQTARTDLNGLVAGSLTLSELEAHTLLERQGSTSGWLTFRASSDGHDGVGHVQLIPPTGISVMSDIDDTIKETHIPAGSREVLRNTFFRRFVAAAGMAEMYRAIEDAAFHYVSGRVSRRLAAHEGDPEEPAVAFDVGQRRAAARQSGRHGGPQSGGDHDADAALP